MITSKRNRQGTKLRICKKICWVDSFVLWKREGNNDHGKKGDRGKAQR